MKDKRLRVVIDGIEREVYPGDTLDVRCTWNTSFGEQKATGEMLMRFVWDGKRLVQE